MRTWPRRLPQPPTMPTRQRRPPLMKTPTTAVCSILDPLPISFRAVRTDARRFAALGRPDSPSVSWHGPVNPFNLQVCGSWPVLLCSRRAHMTTVIALPRSPNQSVIAPKTRAGFSADPHSGCCRSSCRPVCCRQGHGALHKLPRGFDICNYIFCNKLWTKPSHHIRRAAASVMSKPHFTSRYLARKYAQN